MPETDTLGLGFIGCGSYNASLVEAAQRSPKLAPIACWDVSAERTASFAGKHNLDGCATLAELLARGEIEGVVIASPNNAHRANVEAAASAGKHVFVDKPIANTIEDARSIASACEKAGLVLAVGHNGRRMGGHRKMRRMIEDGAVGTPITVEANFSHSGGLGLKPDQWRFYRDQCPGLPLMQLGVHFADTVQYLLGDVTEVSSFMSHVATPAEGDDVTVSLLRFADGLLGYLGSNYATPAVYYANIYGTEGNLYSDWGASLRYRAARAKDSETVECPAVDTQVEELEEFADCVRTGAKPEVDGEAGIKALAIVRAALASNEARRPVTIAEVLTG